GAEGGDAVTAGGNGHQTSQSGVQGHGDIGLAVPHPGEDHGHTGGHGGGQGGVEADQAGERHGLVGGQSQGRAAVKAEPAEPEDKDAQGGGGHVVAGDGVGFAVLVVLADPGAQHPGAQHGDDAAHVVHCGRAGEIVEPKARQPAAAPDPVAGDGVDQQRNGGGVDTVGLEVGALSHGAGDDGGGCGAENGLEHGVNPKGNIQPQMAVIPQHKGIKAADQGAGAAEHQPEAHQPVAG